MEYILCKMQFARKAETSFNVRFHNYRKDAKKPNSMPTNIFSSNDIIQQTCEINL